MVCPRCKTAALCRRRSGLDVFVCRNKACKEYGKQIAVREGVTGEALNDINAGNAEKSNSTQE